MLKTDLTRWIGKTQTLHGGLGPDTAGMLQATLASDDAASVYGGDPMAPLWHWAAFTPKTPMAQISEDGHPMRGDFLPPVPLPRRMWAGGDVSFQAPMHIGAALTQVATVKEVVEKSDQMVFVAVARDTYQNDALCVSEVQNIVYLEIPKVFAPPTPKPVPSNPTLLRREPIGEARLFRYSAATFNAHRIHYDLNYAQSVEKYPGLVVHGPLQATLIMQAAMAHAGRRPARFIYRGIHPIFHTDDLHIFGQDDDQGMTLCTGMPGGHQGMQATLTWEDDR